METRDRQKDGRAEGSIAQEILPSFRPSCEIALRGKRAAAFIVIALVTAFSLIAAAQPKRLLRDPAFLVVAASAALTQSSHSVYYGFSSLEWRNAGLDGTAIAALWSVGVVAEIILFIVAARLPAFLTPSMMLVLGGAGGGLRWLVMAFDPPVYLLPLLQMLHAFSFGMTYLGALFFTSRHAPPGQAATAQGYLAIVIGLAMAAAMALSGWLYGLFGAKAYAAMALAAIVGCAYGAVADRAARRTAGNAL